ncbi:MAG: hypothetical protein FWG02_03510 [Holophagaceae bacterium]|nr:hypothetical protein [Holophagaceae bacterium]
MRKTNSNNRMYFSDYRQDAHNWITLATGEYYPDILENACDLYKPVLVLFGQILRQSETSARLFTELSKITDSWMRIQLARVFRKYVSPDTPVEMLKKKTMAISICEQFGNRFRPINEVQEAFCSRPIPDEALCAVLWEYKDRGKKGYDLTEVFFSLIKKQFPDYEIIGPERAGKDISLGSVFSGYPNPRRPVDFVIANSKGVVLAVGLARYDSDRGGSQEDDRTGGYKNCADEVLSYCELNNLATKIIFINDGPGLLLGSMWADYSDIERRWENKIKVLTLRMVPFRLNRHWIEN